MKMLRNILLMATLALGACTNNFEEINEPPIGLTGDRIDINALFTRATVYGSLRYTEFQRAQQLYCHHYVQYYSVAVASFPTGRYVTQNNWLTDYWDAAYADYLMNTQQILEFSDPTEYPDRVNKHAIARIWKVFLMHRVTDFWGDVPYSEAWQGDPAPAYDPQEEIYLDMLNELEEAVAQMDPSIANSYGAADWIYGGSLDRWTKFANSLRLRLAMRIRNVAPTVAEQHVRAVLTDGNIISTHEETAMMPYGRDFGAFDENIQPMSWITTFDEYRVSTTLIDSLRNNNDPRLEVFVEPARQVGDFSGLPDNGLWDRVQAQAALPGNFVGLPNGLNPEELSVAGNINSYSKDGAIPSNAAAPSALLTLSEVKLLEAEAALLGWHEGDGNAQGHYEDGIRASMGYWQQVHDDLQATLPEQSPGDLEGVPTIDLNPTVVDAYLAEPNVAWSADPQVAMDQIHFQKWLTLLNQGFESYAELRRTGVPGLTPIPDTNGESETGGSDLPRRIRYPVVEQSLNTENYDAALARQGPDLPTTRMWWDVE